MMIMMIIVNEFHRDASLKQNFRAADDDDDEITALLKDG